MSRGTATELRKRDPGHPVFGDNLAKTTVVQFLYQLRVHGIDLLSSTSDRIKVCGFSPSQKTRAKKAWSYAKEQAKKHDDDSYKLVFVNRAMQCPSDEENVQNDYNNWQRQILYACDSIAKHTSAELNQWLLAHQHSLIVKKGLGKVSASLEIKDKHDNAVKQEKINAMIKARQSKP
jgi:hypothetical protein